jgi:hypothetical protein
MLSCKFTTIFIAFCLLATAASAGGLAVIDQPSSKEVRGIPNIVATVIHPLAPNQPCSWSGNEEQAVVFDRGATLRLRFTSDSENWKSSYVGISSGQFIKRKEIPIGDAKTRGDFIEVNISLAELADAIGERILICPIIGQKGSHRSVFFGIGKIGKYVEDYGGLWMKLIDPFVGPESYPSLISPSGKTLSSYEVFLVCNEGLGKEGDQSASIIRQVAQTGIKPPQILQQSTGQTVPVQQPTYIPPPAEQDERQQPPPTRPAPRPTIRRTPSPPETYVQKGETWHWGCNVDFSAGIAGLRWTLANRGQSKSDIKWVDKPSYPGYATFSFGSYGTFTVWGVDAKGKRLTKDVNWIVQ